MCVVCGVLFSLCWLLFGAWCALFVIRCVLLVVRCAYCVVFLRVGCCSLLFVLGSVCVVCCLLRGVLLFVLLYGLC